MEIIQIASVVIGIGTNIPLIIGICKDKIKQSFAAFILWGALDIIAGITTYLEKGNWYLPAGYGLSATTVAVFLLAKKQFSWSKVEWMTLGMVIVCLVIWKTKGEQTAIIASSAAVVVAGIPQMKDTWNDPSSTPKVLYCFFLLANTLSLIAGKAWTIEERFYSSSVVLLTLVILALSMRKLPIQKASTA